MPPHGNIPHILLAGMINTATYIVYRSGSSSVDGLTTFELWTSKKPTSKFLPIDFTCCSHIHKKERKCIEKFKRTCL